MTKRVLVIGNPSDATIVYFLARCARTGLEPDVVSIREVADAGSWDLAVPEDGSSTIRYGEKSLSLGNLSAIYCRWAPSPTSEDPEIESRRRLLLESLRLWTLTSGAKVVNRADGASHNATKPLHESYLADVGFRVPASISSCSADALRAFCGHNGQVVKKGASGGRKHGACRFFDPSELDSYEPSRGPVHLQQYVDGDDLRVHVLEENVIPTLIRSATAAPDYRVSIATATLSDYELAPQVTGLVRDATAHQGLSFCGWDFKVDDRQRLWCLEANPMPAYHFYDVDGRITDALVQALWAEDG